MRKQKRESDMFPLVAAWEASTENQDQFCKSNGINISIFSYWRSKYRKSQQNSSVELFTELQAEKNGFMEVIYPNGVKISLPQNSELSTIQSLISLG